MTSSRLVRVLCAVPLVSLVLNMITWARHGVDLPFYDDWRAYALGNIDSLDPGYLFTALNDTLTPVGFALDAIAQRLLGGSPIAYQLLTMSLVLGGLLWLQWRLLLHALADRLRAATCLLFTLPMLAPGSYWGRENMAYHQALPLLGVLGMLCLVLLPGSLRGRHVAATAVLGVLSGLAYISGAVAVLVVGTTLLALSCLPGIDGRPRLRLHGGAAALAGLVTLALQIRGLVVSNDGLLEAHGGVPMAMPFEPAFWFFLLGKVGRSLLLAPSAGWLALLMTLVVMALVFWLCARLLMQAMKRRRAADMPASSLTVVLIVISAVVASYLLAVAAGRTHFRPPQMQTAVDVFAVGFDRFHHFWVTLLWPWLAAGLWTLWARRDTPLLVTRREVFGIGGLCAVFIALMVWAGAFAHAQAHRVHAELRLGTIACMQRMLRGPPPMYCREFNLHDFAPAYLHGVRTQASFVRYFPMPAAPLGDEHIPVLYRLGDQPSTEVWTRLTPTGDGPGLFAAEDDPQIVMQTGQPQAMAACGLLEVSARMRPHAGDGSQLYFRARGQAQFTEAASRWASAVTSPSDDITVTFQLLSRNGFEDALRWDPVHAAQRVQIDTLEVRCRAPWHYELRRIRDSDIR